MKQNIVRLTQMEIHHVKNVENGCLEFSKGKKGSILGIYGQNGSGKTVVVDCMMLLKNLLCGRRIQQNFFHFINSKSNTADVKYCFEINSNDEKYYAEYEISLLKGGEESFCINAEKLSMKEILQEKERNSPHYLNIKGARKNCFVRESIITILRKIWSI